VPRPRSEADTSRINVRCFTPYPACSLTIHPPTQPIIQFNLLVDVRIRKIHHYSLQTTSILYFSLPSSNHVNVIFITLCLKPLQSTQYLSLSSSNHINLIFMTLLVRSHQCKFYHYPQYVTSMWSILSHFGPLKTKAVYFYVIKLESSSIHIYLSRVTFS